MKYKLEGLRNGNKFEQYFTDFEALMIQDMYLKQNGFNTWFSRVNNAMYFPNEGINNV